MPWRLEKLVPGAVCSVLTSLAACGGSLPAAEEAKVYDPGSRGLDQAMADLDSSEAEIASRFGGTPSGGDPKPFQPHPHDPGGTLGYGQPTFSPPPPPSLPKEEPQAPAPMQPSGPARSPTPPPAPASEGPTDEDETGHEERKRCEIACRALASMRRAAEHVCSAAGSDDDRCGRARQRVAAASARVAASCEDCG